MWFNEWFGRWFSEWFGEIDEEEDDVPPPVIYQPVLSAKKFKNIVPDRVVRQIKREDEEIMGIIHAFLKWQK